MAELIMVEGPTTTGKSRMLHSLPPDKTLIINCDDKMLMFAGSEQSYPVLHSDGKQPNWKGGTDIREARLSVIINKFKTKTDSFGRFDYVVIDTLSNAMLRTVMDNRNVPGYDKFTMFAGQFYDIIKFGKKLPCKYLIIVAHTELDAKGREIFKVPAGKLTSEKIVPESHFSFVFVNRCVNISDTETEYITYTRSDGTNYAKTPEGMFRTMHIPNDMGYIIQCIDAWRAGEPQPEPPIELKSFSPSKDDDFVE